MLEVENVSTFYGEYQAIHDVSLRVESGRLVSIFGPNGHGKSTLLKTICGLMKPASGVIRFEGREIQGLPSHKLVEMGVVLISEERHLFPEMTVTENLRLGAYAKSARAKEAENLEFVFGMFPKLKTLAKKTALTLSGGEARMLAIGRGLMSNARFLAVDEPSFGLAPILRTQVFEQIVALRDRGLSILLVEQTTGDIAEQSDYIYLLEDGRIAFSGSKEEALHDDVVRKVFLGIT
jgi:branched-chain amino acid transport system ATP-binding protein